MDIRREPRARRSKALLWGGAGIVLLAVTVGLGALRPAAPALDRATLVIDTVRRGELVRDIQASGMLVPERTRIVAAVTAGRVEALPIRPGASVGPTTRIVRLSNTDVELQALQSEQQLAAALSALASLRSSLLQQRLAQEGVLAQTTTGLADAMRSVAVLDSLDRRRLAAANELAAARDRARELATRLEVEKQRLAEMTRAQREQVVLMEDQVTRLRAIVAAQRARVGAMDVTAGEAGQLQSLPLELGQWVNPGTELARVAQPGRLKAVLRVPEVQAKNVAIGQRARIDTRNGIVPGHVMRADPAAQNGTVAVEIALDGPLPSGTRSDLSVDGTIEIERLQGVLYTGRPAYADPGSSVGIFRLAADGREASRATVKLGRASANAIEIVSGLAAGDRLILSDMSQWDDVSRVRLK